MIYSSLEPQFLLVSASLTKNKGTPRQLVHEDVDDFSDDKSSSSVAVPIESMLSRVHRFGTGSLAIPPVNV